MTTPPPVHTPGFNLAMKVPVAHFKETVAFYEHTLGLTVKQRTPEGSAIFDFGGKNLWLDPVESADRAELWLDIRTTDLAASAEHLASHHIQRCDDVEPLPADLKAFWVRNPAGIVHLITEE